MRNSEAAKVDFELGVNVPEKQRLAKEEVENLKTKMIPIKVMTFSEISKVSNMCKVFCLTYPVFQGGLIPILP